MVQCQYCQTAPAVLKRPKTSEKICKACFFDAFETEVHETITANQLFTPGERVAIAASGGKDSTVLAHVLTTLNTRHSYGLNLFLLSIDEGITGYRDDSLESVKRNQVDYQIPLKILSYKDLYGWTMDEIVSAIGRSNNCTFCGVFRRQALDRGAVMMKADKIVTGHNCDDIAETVLMNLLRGDIARLERCTAITTGKTSSLPRCKPFKYTYEKEIVMYAYYKKLDYFSTECIYSPNAYRGFAREFLKDLEKVKSRAIVDIVRSGEHFRINKDLLLPAVNVIGKKGKDAASSSPDDDSSSEPSSASSAALKKHHNGITKKPTQSLGVCERCNYISSNRICKACVLLEGLNKARAKVGVEATSADGNSAASSSSSSSASFTSVPNRTETSAINGRSIIGRGAVGFSRSADESKESSSSIDQTPLAEATSSAAVASLKPKKSGEVSATMEMAQKMKAHDW